jgi:hypothetical protein
METLGLVAALGGSGQVQAADPFQETATGMSQETAAAEVTAKQEEGNVCYWVLPGERRLSPHVFGTPENPRFGSELLQTRIEQATRLPSPLSNAIPQLLEDLPFLVAVPEDVRAPTEDESIAREKLTVPSLYSDNARVTSGAFEVTYADRQPIDLPGPPGNTEDTAVLDARFTDPAGNEYELDLDHIVQPPFPGYQTGGGVLTNAWHHGITGTGSPLMPQLFAYGAFWGVGDVLVNGEVATTDGFRVIHFMTTQTVRNKRYRLALDEELPLAPTDTIAGQIHHTHGVVLPIKPTADGPVFDPVPTAFELPNGETQPFIHAMWEQDTIESGPFRDWEFPSPDDGAEDDQQGGNGADANVRLLGLSGGWQGQSPEAIADETNPSLELEVGVEYTLVWENGDGIQHNFAIEDGSGNDILTTELLGEEGATQSVTFAVTPEMEEYYCQVHPGTMRGPIETVS